MQKVKLNQNLNQRRKYDSKNIDKSKYEYNFEKCQILQTKQSQYDFPDQQKQINLEKQQNLMDCQDVISLEQSSEKSYDFTKQKQLFWNYFNFSEIDQELQQKYRVEEIPNLNQFDVNLGYFHTLQKQMSQQRSFFPE